MVRSVIFDLDGTLLNTLNHIAQCANVTLKNNGYPVHEISQYRKFIGNGMKKFWERIIPADQVSSENMVRLIEEFRSLSVTYSKDLISVYPGVAEMLRTLQGMGIPVSVLSNKLHSMTVQSVDIFFPGVPFTHVIGGFPDGVLKPAPDNALFISNDLKIEPEYIVFVGDMAVDMMTARNAGMHPVGVLWGFGDRDELENAGAELLLEKPEDIVSLFK